MLSRVLWQRITHSSTGSTKLSDALEDDSVDAVIIASTTHAHYEVSITQLSWRSLPRPTPLRVQYPRPRESLMVASQPHFKIDLHVQFPCCRRMEASAFVRFRWLGPFGWAVGRQQVVACFEAGKAVLCEKPISHDPERLGR